MKKIQPIPKAELEQAFQKATRQACQTLADACYDRIMENPKKGLEYLSAWALLLDFRLEIKLQPTNNSLKENGE